MKAIKKAEKLITLLSLGFMVVSLSVMGCGGGDETAPGSQPPGTSRSFGDGFSLLGGALDDIAAGGTGTTTCSGGGTKEITDISLTQTRIVYNNCDGLSGDITITDDGNSIVADGSMNFSSFNCSYTFNNFSQTLEGTDVILNGGFTSNCGGASISCNFNNSVNLTQDVANACR
ncbi:MAG TPA: hypothetical protein DF383_00175 [Deltaproteobacteria bacterium]|nr:hypothetical protein [Deltaproteobacteria bacterium]